MRGSPRLWQDHPVDDSQRPEKNYNVYSTAASSIERLRRGGLGGKLINVLSTTQKMFGFIQLV